MNCPDNCGCKVIMERNEKDIQRVWRAMEKTNNNIRSWGKLVLISAGSVLLFVGTNIVKFIIVLVSGPTP